VLQFLFAHCTMPDMVYRHSWRRNDLVIWDNRSVMHFAVSDYKGVGDRYMHRTTVQGDRPH
jgi:taurine dioxygenase